MNRQSCSLPTAKTPQPPSKRPSWSVEAAAVNSFEKIAREWHKHQLPRWTPSHAARVLHSLEFDAFPMLGSLPITDIKAPLLLEAVRAIEARGVPATAARVLQRIKSVFNYAIQTGRAADNPAFILAGAIVKEKAQHQPALPQKNCRSFTAACWPSRCGKKHALPCC